MYKKIDKKLLNETIHKYITATDKIVIESLMEKIQNDKNIPYEYKGFVLVAVLNALAKLIDAKNKQTLAGMIGITKTQHVLDTLNNVTDTKEKQKKITKIEQITNLTGAKMLKIKKMYDQAENLRKNDLLHQVAQEKISALSKSEKLLLINKVQPLLKLYEKISKESDDKSTLLMMVADMLSQTATLQIIEEKNLKKKKDRESKSSIAYA